MARSRETVFYNLRGLNGGKRKRKKENKIKQGMERIGYYYAQKTNL